MFNDSLARVEYRRNSGDSMYYVIDDGMFVVVHISHPWGLVYMLPW